MIDIYNFKSYKEYVNKWILHQPKRGYGQYRKIAQHLRVGTVLISQIFKGDRDLNEEQALELSQYINLLEDETKFFIGLVRLSKAHTKPLKVHIQNELNKMKEAAKELKSRVRSEVNLDESAQAIFHSDWYYSAIRLAVDIPKLRNIESLSHHLNLPPEKIKMAVEFLIKSGLCIMENGELKMGPQIVYLPAESPYIIPRQKNWRIKGFQSMEEGNKNNLFFTCPLVCSTHLKDHIRKKILELISDVLKEVKESPSEELVCFNIDFFQF